MEWQSIETAPKDGTFIDLWCVRDHHNAGHQERRWCYASWQDWTGTPEWIIAEEDGELAIGDWTPTHWIPEPEPPKS